MGTLRRHLHFTGQPGPQFASPIYVVPTFLSYQTMRLARPATVDLPESTRGAKPTPSLVLSLPTQFRGQGVLLDRRDWILPKGRPSERQTLHAHRGRHYLGW